MISREKSILLVIDDHQDWHHHIRNMMSTESDIEVITATSVQAGLGLMCARPVDFVILARRFSLMNGSSKEAESFLQSQGIEFVYFAEDLSRNKIEEYTNRGIEIWEKNLPFDVIRARIIEKLHNIERTHAC